MILHWDNSGNAARLRNYGEEMPHTGCELELAWHSSGEGQWFAWLRNPQTGAERVVSSEAELREAIEALCSVPPCASAAFGEGEAAESPYGRRAGAGAFGRGGRWVISRRQNTALVWPKGRGRGLGRGQELARRSLITCSQASRSGSLLTSGSNPNCQYNAIAANRSVSV